MRAKIGSTSTRQADRQTETWNGYVLRISQRHTSFNKTHLLIFLILFHQLWTKYSNIRALGVGGISVQTTTSCITQKPKPVQVTDHKSCHSGVLCTMCRHLDKSERTLGSTAGQSPFQQLFTTSTTLGRTLTNLPSHSLSKCEVCSTLEFPKSSSLPPAENVSIRGNS